MTTHPEHLTREDIAKREIGQTDISRPCTWAMAGLFVATILAVPVAQHVHELSRRPGWPQCYDILAAAPRAVRALGGSPLGPVGRVFHANRAMLGEINRYEDALADESLLKGLLVPPTQAVMTAVGGVGNEKAHVGREGWLFYRDSIDHVTGPGFLDPRRLARRAAGGSEWRPAPQPDPVAAVADFAAALARRDIRLILLPAPAKPSIHPEKYSRRCQGLSAPLQNASFDLFARRVRAAFDQKMAPAGPAGAVNEVLIFDPAPLLVEAKRRTGQDQYLRTDTHWRPEAMELVARALAAFIAERVNLPPAPPPKHKRISEQVTNLGDLGRMLLLPAGQRLLPPETVTIRPVLTGQAEEWRADPAADVLVLGDSFCNIYSLESMGWGRSAGLVEQLGYHLGRPLDRFVRNDAGAFATREALAREGGRGRDRLAGKRLVIWQFAARELSVGDWRLLEVKTPEQVAAARRAADGDGEFLVLPPGRTLRVRGTVLRLSAVPRPGMTAYRDHVLTMHLADLEGVDAPLVRRQAVVLALSMKDHTLTPAARLRPGDAVTLRLAAWPDVAAKHEKLDRSDLQDPELDLVEPNWAAEIEIDK